MQSHVCITMGYFEELKEYKLFDAIKQEIIVENTLILRRGV
jgi:hypothetical protein